MLRRLLLILSLLFTTLFAAAWIASYLRPGAAMITPYHPQGLGVWLYTGAVAAYRMEGHPTPTIEFIAITRADGKDLDDSFFQNRRLGFDSVSQTLIGIRFPLWPPTLLFAILSVWLHRRHRRLPTGKGFEVHPTE